MFIKEDPHSVPSRNAALGQDERRYLPRWEVSNKILYQREDELVAHECLSKDINATGACIRTTSEIKPNQKLNLTVYLADDIEPVRVHGKVVWYLNRNAETWAGIQFDAVNDKTGELIYNYAFEYKKDQLMKNWFKGS